jgi:hypothetical protein
VTLCTIDLTGAVTSSSRWCRVTQEYEPQRLDASFKFLEVRSLGGGMPYADVSLRVDGTPTVGTLPAGSYWGWAHALDGASQWAAMLWPNRPAGSRGRISVTLTRVRRVVVEGKDAYEMHGTIDVELVPDNHPAIGTVMLRATF